MLTALAAGTAALAATGLAALYQGAFTTRHAAADLAALLRPHYRVHRPAGPGPFPTAILVPGCVGVREHAELWASQITAAGWAAVVVDSHTPRDWHRPDMIARICTGRMFWGTARAGDVLVALDEVRRMDMVDPERLVLCGWSHGGWAIMDLLALDPPRRLPFNLKDIPPGFARTGFAGVRGILLLYPYAGFGNRARRSGWRHPARTLMLLAGADTIVSTDASLATARALRARGHTVETHVYDGINHGFDDTFHWPGSPLVHDPVASADAYARVARFLRSLAPDHPQPVENRDNLCR